MANVVKTWDAFPSKLVLTPRQKVMVKEYDKVAGMEGKAEGRRCSMDGYENESFEYFGPRDRSGGTRVNIYLLNKKARTVKQCVNMVRSKFTIESRMYKNGKHSSWYKTMLPYINGSIDVQELIQFAADVCNLPAGDEEIYSTECGGWFPNELIEPHKGLRAADFHRRVWIDLRKMKMSKSGKPMVRASRPPKHGKVKGKEDVRSAEEDLLMGSSTQSESSESDDYAHRLSDGKAGRDSATKHSRIKASEDYSALPVKAGLFQSVGGASRA
jgi:hypothetical protein